MSAPETANGSLVDLTERLVRSGSVTDGTRGREKRP